MVTSRIIFILILPPLRLFVFGAQKCYKTQDGNIKVQAQRLFQFSVIMKCISTDPRYFILSFVLLRAAKRCHAVV